MNALESSWFDLLFAFVNRTPMIVVGLAGLGYAISQRRRAPRAATLAMTACVLLLAVSVFSAIWGVLIFPVLVRNMNLGAGIRWLNLVSFGVLNLGSAAGVALLLVAVFANRDAPGPRAWPAGDDEGRPAPRPPPEGRSGGEVRAGEPRD